MDSVTSDLEVPDRQIRCANVRTKIWEGTGTSLHTPFDYRTPILSQTKSILIQTKRTVNFVLIWRNPRHEPRITEETMFCACWLRHKGYGRLTTQRMIRHKGWYGNLIFDTKNDMGAWPQKAIPVWDSIYDQRKSHNTFLPLDSRTRNLCRFLVSGIQW